MIIYVMLASVIVVMVSFLLIGFNIIFLKRKFPETSVGHNKNMRKLGITCVKCEELARIKTQKNKLKINPKELKIAFD